MKTTNKKVSDNHNHASFGHMRIYATWAIRVQQSSKIRHDKDHAIGGNLLLLHLLGVLIEILYGQLDRLVARNDNNIIFFARIYTYIYPFLNQTPSRWSEYHSWDQVSPGVIFYCIKGLLYSRM